MTGTSLFSLRDPDRVWRDPKAKTLAFFCKTLPAKVNRDLISELIDISESEGKVNVRVSLHDGPDAPFHDMIILERPGPFYPPHKHLQKGETWHVMDGRMGVFVFDDDGGIVDTSVVAAGEIYRLSLDTNHAVLPLGDYVVYHESKPGPFLGNADSLYPTWGPANGDTAAQDIFTARLRAAIEPGKR